MSETTAISWWSWRPGIRPGFALALGSGITLLALVLVSLGLFALFAGILDSFSPPQQVTGIVTKHEMSADSLPYLTLQLHTTPPETLSLVVSTAAFQHLPVGTPLRIDYAPRLSQPYALDFQGQHYLLPGRNADGNPIGALSLLLIALLVLPYPALIAHWGWRDLLDRARGVGYCSLTARVLARRSSGNPLASHRQQPGLSARIAHSWYAVALQAQDGPPLVFHVSQEMYEEVHLNEQIRITYTPHTHYLYKVEHVS